jgi:hypothetical protein
MARVLITNITSGDVPGHDLIRVPYEDGVTDPADFLRDAADAWRRSYSLDDDLLRAVVLRFTARPTAGVLDIRDMMAKRLLSEGTRLVLVVPAALVAQVEAAIDARPSRVRTYAISPADLLDFVAERVQPKGHAWPIPLNPKLGGTGRRVGGGRHVPWSLCVTDPTPDPREAP